MVSCSAFEYHPYTTDVRGETGINTKNIKLIEDRFENSETVVFAF